MLEFEISIDQLVSGKPLVVTLSADDDARARLAKRFDWVEVSALTAEIKLKSIANDAYHASGEVNAAIVQRCRVTELAVAEKIIIVINERFADLSEESDEAEIDPMAMTVEALIGNTIPVGEMIAQLVGLEANPWPRHVSAVCDAVPPQQDKTNPFASLAQLKKKL